MPEVSEIYILGWRGQAGFFSSFLSLGIKHKLTGKIKTLDTRVLYLYTVLSEQTQYTTLFQGHEVSDGQPTFTGTATAGTSDFTIKDDDYDYNYTDYSTNSTDYYFFGK